MEVGKKAILTAAAALIATTVLFADGFKGTENLAFDGKGNLYVTDTNNLWRVDPAGELEKIYDRDEEKDAISLGGVSLGPEGRIYFSTGNKIMIYDPADGSVEKFVDGFGFANGNCFDDSGNFYFAESNKKVMYVVPAGTREVKALKEKAGWVNGVVYSRNDNTLYFTISSPGRVGGYRLGPGPVVEEEITVAKFPFGGLDDLTMDDFGNFYVCLWMNKKIVRVTPSGEKELYVDDVDGPSAVAFGLGEDSRKLFICVKGATMKFKGTQVVYAETDANGYKLPFLP